MTEPIDFQARLRLRAESHWQLGEATHRALQRANILSDAIDEMRSEGSDEKEIAETLRQAAGLLESDG